MVSTDMPFTHMNFGTEIRVEQDGCECAIVFVSHTDEQALSLAESLLEQLKAGVIFIKVGGKPTNITET